MSLDMNGFLNDVKRAAVEAVAAGKPCAFTFGMVTSVSPLKIQVDQKLELTAAQLILTSAVRDFTVEATLDHETGDALSTHTHEFSGTTEGGSHSHTYSGTTSGVNLIHSHSYAGRKAFRVHLALKAGEQVLLLRADGGQKFIVLDRVEVPT